MRVAALVLVGGALLCVGPPACNGSVDADGNARDGDGSTGTGGFAGAAGSDGAAADACVNNVSAAQKAVNDYLASQNPCSLDSDCTLLKHFQIQFCTGWCVLALRSDAVAGLEQVGQAAAANCQYCGGDPYKNYPDCFDALPLPVPSAGCKAGDCVVVYPAADADAGDASSATTPDASAD